jgi:hypothetical protein
VAWYCSVPDRSPFDSSGMDKYLRPHLAGRSSEWNCAQLQRIPGQTTLKHVRNCDGRLSELAIWLNCQFCQWRENFPAPTLVLVAADVIVCQELRAPDAIWMPRAARLLHKRSCGLCQSCNAPMTVRPCRRKCCRKSIAIRTTLQKGKARGL